MQRLSPPSTLRQRWISPALTVLCALLAASPVWLFAHANFGGGATEYSEPTPSNYRVVLFGWFDTARGREVPARLFWPDGARQGTVPLVLFSHGIGSSDDGYTHLGRHWASHGIASLHVRHVGSDRSMWEGNPLEVMQRIERAANDEEAVNRAADLRWALDSVLSGHYSTYIDATRIVVAGHSYGANTAMLVAGARVERDGRILALGDSRIAAAILISAPPFYGETDLASIVGGIAIPSLHVTTAEDIIRLPGYGSGVADRKRLFRAMGGDRTLAMFEQGSHNVFTDRRYFDSAAVADSVKASTQQLTLAFLNALGEGSDGQFMALSTLEAPGIVVRSRKASPQQLAVAQTQSLAHALPPRRSAP